MGHMLGSGSLKHLPGQKSNSRHERGVAMHRVALVLLLATAVTAPSSSLKAQINAGQRPNVVLIILEYDLLTNHGLLQE